MIGKNLRKITLIMIGAALQGIFFYHAPALAADAETVVGGKCTACHSVDRIREAAKSKAEWKVLVDKEVERGASLDEEEQAAAVDWLAENYGETNQAGSEQVAAAESASNSQSENTETVLPFDEQAYTGVELWHFILVGGAFFAAGFWMRRRRPVRPVSLL